MIARLWIKHRVNPHPQGITKGDIAEILPIDADEGKLMYRSHYPVDMDITIPCGTDFKPPYKCATCVDNHPDTCDVKKLKTAEWSEGGVLDPPKVVKARANSVDIVKLIPKELEAVAYKEVKTAKEKTDIKAYTLLNPKTKTAIIDKLNVDVKVK